MAFRWMMSPAPKAPLQQHIIFGDLILVLFAAWNATRHAIPCAPARVLLKQLNSGLQTATVKPLVSSGASNITMGQMINYYKTLALKTG